MANTADFSEPNHVYRYKLTRDTIYTGNGAWPGGHKRVVWIMLNPSTADADFNDPTIEAVMAFSERWGATQVAVVNLYAYRATNPKDLKTVSDPIGRENDWWIRDTVRWADVVIVAWGAHAEPERAAWVTNMLPADGRTFHLGLNKNGSPKHPLYIKRDTVPQPYHVEDLR